MTDIKIMLGHVFLLNGLNVFNGLYMNVAAWSVSAEFFCYPFFPLIGRWIWKSRRVGLQLSLIIFGGLIFWVAMDDSQKQLDRSFDLGFWRCFAEMFLGVLTYVAYSKRWFEKFFSKDLVFCLLGLLIFFVLFFNLHDLWVIPLFAGLILAASFNEGRAQKFLKVRVLQVMGDASYSIYLSHLLVLNVLRVIWFKWNGRDLAGGAGQYGGLSYFVMTLMVVFVFSHFSYLLIERPLGIWVKNVFFKRTIIQ